jgi:hypothetical protein
VGGAPAALEAGLRQSSERVRVAATRGLNHAALAGGPVGPILEKALHDPARDVRDAAVVGLGTVWAARPVGELGKLIQNETDADTRYAAAVALCRQASSSHGDPAVKLLDDLGKHKSLAVRLAARVARAFVTRPEQMGSFLLLLRHGG